MRAMNAGERIRARRRRALTSAGAAVACLWQVLSAAMPAKAEEPPPDQESELGQSVFNELREKGEIKVHSGGDRFLVELRAAGGATAEQVLEAALIYKPHR